ALWRRGYGRRMDQGVRTDVFRHEVGMAAETVARTLDLDDDGMMKKSIEQCRGDDWVAEDLTPFCEAAVGSEDHGSALVAGVDELEEQIAAAWDDRQVADFINDEQGEAAEESDLLSQRALAFGLGKRAHEIGERAEVHAAPGSYGLHPERQRQVAFACTWRSQEVYNLFALDELQLGERHDAVLVA